MLVNEEGAQRTDTQLAFAVFKCKPSMTSQLGQRRRKRGGGDRLGQHRRKRGEGRLTVGPRSIGRTRNMCELRH